MRDCSDHMDKPVIDLTGKTATELEEGRAACLQAAALIGVPELEEVLVDMAERLSEELDARAAKR